jgi:V/A-type H+-transporting ATPase subunit I
VAHGWNAVRQWPGIACIGQLGWIGITWVMYFVARYLVLGADSYPLPSFCGWLFGASLAAVILFMTPWRRLRHEYTGHIMLPLTVIGCFGDVVSYLRLYLVNSAAVTLILALNELAVGKGIRGAWAGLGAALILFAAHALNILLSALAVLVHGIRLNALEFSSHLGIQWSGVPFVPFANGGAPAPETESAAGGG